MASTLMLLRHAQAEWARPGMRDFDRPLSAAGVEEARVLARAMLADGHRPGFVLCSTALRARQTWEVLEETLPGCLVGYSDALYESDSAGYLAIVRNAGRGSSLLLVGHNPMTEDLAIALTQGQPPDGAMAAGFPTCALAVIGFQTELAEIEPGSGRLVAFISQRAHA